MSSFDQVIKNILSDLFGSNEQEDVIRPKPRPSGLGAPTTSLRPRSRPEQDDDDEVAIPSGTESTSKFISSMADFDDTPEEGVDIPLSTLQTDARNLNGKYKTTAMQLAKLNKGAPLTDGGRANVKVAGIEEDTTVQDLLSEIEMVMDPLSSIRPRARPKSVAEIQAIEKEQRSYTEVDSTKDLQVALNAAGITVNGKPLVEDGIMGNNTKKAIKSFQEREGLKVDGIAGPNTKQALRSVAPDSPIVESLVFDTRPSVAREGQIAGENRFSDALINERLLSLAKGDIESDGLMSRPTASRVSAMEVEDVKTASIINSIPLPKAIKKPLKDVSNILGAIFSPVGKNFINDMIFGGGYLAQGNPLKTIPGVSQLGLGEQRTVGAEVFSSDAIELMRRLVLDAQNEDGTDIFDNGNISVGKEVYGKGGLSVNQAKGGASAKEIIKSLSEGDDPINEIKLMLGQFNANIDNNGDIIVSDQFNYNEIIVDGTEYKTEEYEQAIKDGKLTDAGVMKKILARAVNGKLDYKTVRDLAFVLGSRSYKDEEKTQGRRFEINLGPAVSRPKVRSNV
jgi:peptidoglycan hydrolase-like protein with peptidoglycan-binding domain